LHGGITIPGYGRDAEALVACFTKDGTFCNPDTYPGIGGEDLANFVKGVWMAFPDISFELLNAGEIELVWLPTTGKRAAPTPALEPTEANPRDAPSRLRELPSFRLRETRFAQINVILTGTRSISSLSHLPDWILLLCSFVEPPEEPGSEQAPARVFTLEYTRLAEN
jgi:hypothetical protein